MTPRQIGEMSMWQFSSVLAGMSESGESLSASERDDLWDWLKEKDGN